QPIDSSNECSLGQMRAAVVADSRRRTYALFGQRMRLLANETRRSAKKRHRVWLTTARQTRSAPSPARGGARGGGWHARALLRAPTLAPPQPAAGLPASGKF